MVAEQRVEVDARVFNVDVVKRACYALGALFSFRIEHDSPDRLSVYATALQADTTPMEIEQTFRRTLIDFDIRQTLARDTAEIRDLIFRQAFVEADL